MHIINKVFESEIWQGLVSISPFALAFFLFSFWEPLFTTIPDKSELKVISGSINSIGKKSGSVKVAEGSLKVSYECLCDYGWGEKSFVSGMPIYGLGQQDGNGYRLWELEMNDNKIFDYDSIATIKLERKNDAMNIGIPGIVISIALLIQLGVQKIKGRQSQKEQEVLFGLLDELADISKADSERLTYLDKILTYKIYDIIEALEIIAMSNANSDHFLSRIGAELGRLWSEMEIEEIEAITYIQPAAKKSAIEVIKIQRTDLHAKLQEVGLVRA